MAFGSGLRNTGFRRSFRLTVLGAVRYSDDSVTNCLRHNDSLSNDDVFSLYSD
jgi:hypothetical protein